MEFEMEEPSTLKKERGANFTPEELELLVSLVEVNKATLESKKADSITWREKNKAWSRLTAEYNSRCAIFRSKKNLYEKYNRIKKDARRKLKMKKKSVVRSIGVVGSSTSVEERVKSLILPSDKEQDNDADSDESGGSLWNRAGWTPSLPSQLTLSNGCLKQEDTDNIDGDSNGAMPIIEEILIVDPTTNPSIAATQNSRFPRRAETTPVTPALTMMQKSINTAKARIQANTLYNLEAKKMELIQLQINELKQKEERQDLFLSILKEEVKQAKLKTTLLELEVQEKRKQLEAQ